MRFSGHRRGSRPEDRIEDHPVDGDGRPDLSTFHRPAEVYARLHADGIAESDFAKRVEGSWGLIARGAESVPFLVDLLHHRDPEARADGASGLATFGVSDPSVEHTLVAALEEAATDEERDTLLQALGQMRSRAAIPAIAALLHSDATDDDTRGMAIEALGKIARRRFDKGSDPLSAALDYIHRAGL